jgi:hypothetical protein
MNSTVTEIHIATAAPPLTLLPPPGDGEKGRTLSELTYTMYFKVWIIAAHSLAANTNKFITMYDCFSYHFFDLVVIGNAYETGAFFVTRIRCFSMWV